MNTAQEMYDFCLNKKYGQGFNQSWALKHFGVIESNLSNDEDVIMCFIGLHNYISATKHDGNFAYAVTKKRIIIGQKKVIGEKLQSVFLDNINDITFKKSMIFGIITIDTMKEKFSVALDNVQAANINSEIHDILHSLKQQNNTTQSIEKENDAVNELRKYKALLDDGIINNDDFELKKKQLLGI